MTDLPFMQKSAEVIKQLMEGGGGFLTVATPDEVNTMTIGWAQLGVFWNLELLTVAVRKSRHTFWLMERAVDFTVSIPWEDCSRTLAYCGSHSGREGDKFIACGLEKRAARKVQSPVVSLRGLHYECRTAFKAPMDTRFLNSEMESLYPQRDYHTLYFGEVLACYETD
jgi:flavin reductase (DIM6/NTAB) family NADH-FMN oxidoreductase RutF